MEPMKNNQSSKLRLLGLQAAELGLRETVTENKLVPEVGPQVVPQLCPFITGMKLMKPTQLCGYLVDFNLLSYVGIIS